MRIILSRKGFDSSSGGCSSPIFPDGSMISLPIPDKRSPIRYRDLTWRERNLGDVVAKLTHGKQRNEYRAHLDPDLRKSICARELTMRSSNPLEKVVWVRSTAQETESSDGMWRSRSCRKRTSKNFLLVQFIQERTNRGLSSSVQNADAHEDHGALFKHHELLYQLYHSGCPTKRRPSEGSSRNFGNVS